MDSKGEFWGVFYKNYYSSKSHFIFPWTQKKTIMDNNGGLHQTQKDVFFRWWVYIFTFPRSHKPQDNMIFPSYYVFAVMPLPSWLIALLVKNETTMLSCFVLFFLLIKVCFPLWLNVSVGGWINSTSLRPFINFFNFKFGFWKSGNALHNEICCSLLFNKAAPVF